MSVSDRTSRPARIEPVRPDVELFESDAGPGEIALIVKHRGVRVIRLEIAESMYTPEVAERVLRFVEENLPPLISLVRDSSPPDPA